MRSPLFLFLLLSAALCKAQAPDISVDGKSNNGVSLEVLKIDVKVCGAIVKTSWEMTFRNHTDKVLEGALKFPLKEGISVSRYALDINGKLREAVPVDRSKGAVVFEAIERRRVDPGLLEKLDGNVFRTRIYPINAKSTRTVLIGYEEEMTTDDKKMRRYNLPMGLKDTVKQFSITVTVNQANSTPFFDALPGNDLIFSKAQQRYLARMERSMYVPQQPLAFNIPVNEKDPEAVFQEFENKHYFFLNTPVVKNERAKQLPKAICLLWDASISGLKRNLQKETALLDQYFKRLQTINVRLVVFNTKVRSNEVYKITGGNWQTLRSAINNIQYDGATSLSALDISRFAEDECILVSDGLQTFGSASVKPGKQPMYCINSAAVADYSALKLLSVASGGEFIDLLRDDSAVAFKKLITETYRFLGIRSNEQIKEYYPSLKVPVTGQFSLAGIATEDLEEIVLYFGYGNTITEEKTFKVNPENNSCDGFDLTKLFAQKKITELDLQYEKNKTAIEALGNRYGVITRNTSLIVLETVEDYITYNIYPPAELRTEYNRIKKSRSTAAFAKKKDDMEAAMEMIAELKTWWNKSGKVAQKKITTPPPPPPPAAVPVTTMPPPVRNDTSMRGRRVLSGTVKDKDGNPVPFAVVKVKGSNNGLSADANGNYSIRVNNNDVLEISGTGYATTQAAVGTQQNLNTTLDKNVNELREVVVTGAYATRRMARSTTSNVQSFSTEEINTIRQDNVSNALAGRVAGVQLRGNSTAVPGSETIMRLRGENSFVVSTDTLLIVNGSIMPKGFLLPADSIHNIDVLQPPVATALFGAEGSNGAVIIQTKSFIAANGAKQHAFANPDSINYLKLIKNVEPSKRYAKYLELRPLYMDQAAYFLEVAAYFYRVDNRETAFTILSNLAELSNNDYELLKMLGYKLKEAGDYAAEVEVFKKVLQLRPLEPQSYRDYALALEDNGLYQKAIEMLYEGMVKINDITSESLYDGIEEIFLVEINRILSVQKNVQRGELPKEFVVALPVDIRVVLNWNKSNTDIDLWVTDPAGEKCYYGYAETSSNGRISDDFTEGFGPEQFLLKKALKGTYKIEVDYYSDNQVTLAGPVTIMAEIYTHYGTPQQQRKVIVLQMKKDAKGGVFVGELEYK